MDKLGIKRKVLESLLESLDDDMLGGLKKGEGEIKVMKMEVEPKEEMDEDMDSGLAELKNFKNKEEPKEIMPEEEDEDEFAELKALRNKYRGE